jgi:hypothetical protein
MSQQKVKRKPQKKVYRLLYGKDDMKIAPESKVENFKWEFITSNKRENNERKHNGM